MNTKAAQEYFEVTDYLRVMGLGRLTYKTVPTLLAAQLPRKIRTVLRKCDKRSKTYLPWNDPIYQHNLHVKQVRCDKLVARYAKLGIAVKTGSYNPKVYEVRLDFFTAEQWVDLLDRGGELLTMCCALVSEVRDLLGDAARNGRWMNVRHLAEAATMLRDHSCGDPPEPLDKLCRVWDVVKDDAMLPPMSIPEDPNTVEGAVGVLTWGSSGLQDIFMREPPPAEQHWHAVNRLWLMYRLVPAVTTLYNKLLADAPPPLTGYALYQGDEVLTNRLGICVYESEKQAAEWADIMRRDDRQPVIRKVRVSVREGIQPVGNG